MQILQTSLTATTKHCHIGEEKLLVSLVQFISSTTGK